MILGLEAPNFWGTVAFLSAISCTAPRKPITKKDAKLISITASDLYMKSNYQDFQRYTEVDLAMAADAEATLPSLIEAVKRQITDDRKRTFADRGKKLAAQHEERCAARAMKRPTAGTPAPSARRVCARKFMGAIKNEDWSLVSEVSPWVNRWPLRLWNFDKYYQYIGTSGGFGVGYGAPAAVGAALANKKHGRLSVSIQNDGDLMYAPGSAVDLGAPPHPAAQRDAQQPRLSPGSDARAAHGQPAQSRHRRAPRSARPSQTPISISQSSPRAWAFIPKAPLPIRRIWARRSCRAVEVVKRGEPALVDAVTQPR